MRVLHIIDGLGGGGAETSLAEIAPALTGRGIELHVAFFAPQEDMAGRLDATGVQLWRLTDATSRLGHMRACRSLIGRLRPDLVHTTLFESDLAGRTAAASLRTPVVSSLVNEMYGPRQRAAGVPWPKLRAAQAFDLGTARFVDRFHAVSDTVASVMVKRLRIPASKVTVIHRARDPQLLGQYSLERRERVRRSLGLDDDVALVLGVGRLEPQKGFINLIDAVSLLRRDGLPVTALIAGRAGNDSETIDSAIRRQGLRDVVKLLGRREDVADLMVAADVLAFTSLWEGFGGTVVEALALECPIVCSDLPVLREVLAEHATFVQPQDPVSLARALAQTLREGRLQHRLSAGRRYFLEHYTLDVCADRTVEMYREVTEQ